MDHYGHIAPEDVAGAVAVLDEAGTGTAASSGTGRQPDGTRKMKSPENRALRAIGAGNGIRTRDFDLGKVALYH